MVFWTHLKSSETKFQEYLTIEKYILLGEIYSHFCKVLVPLFDQFFNFSGIEEQMLLMFHIHIIPNGVNNIINKH